MEIVCCPSVQRFTSSFTLCTGNSTLDRASSSAAPLGSGIGYAAGGAGAGSGCSASTSPVPLHVGHVTSASPWGIVRHPSHVGQTMLPAFGVVTGPFSAAPEGAFDGAAAPTVGDVTDVGPTSPTAAASAVVMAEVSVPGAEGVAAGPPGVGSSTLASTGLPSMASCT